MNLSYLLNSAWMWHAAGEAYAFRRACANARAAQLGLLRRIVRRNTTTAYGREYRFAALRSVADFQQAVPLTRYETLRPYIQRIAAGEQNVLTGEPVRLLEPTGGTSGGEKLIPFTDSLQRQYQRALATWIWDSMHRHPGMRHGRAFWSISPAAAPRITPGGIRIGFEDDRAYLARSQRWIVSRLLAVPPEVTRCQSLSDVRYVTLLYLLQAADLALISVWSPTYLTVLLNEWPRWIDAICEDLRHGRVCPPESPSTGIAQRLPLAADPRRADQLAAIFRSGRPLADKLAECWPRLCLISCWADAAAAFYLPALRALFPHTRLQPKGLLATEGVVSFPLGEHPGGALAIRSHFFEFFEVPPHGTPCSLGTVPRLVDELEPGRRYRVVITTGGGLYRYQLGDEIEVIDSQRGATFVSFVGRADAISDLVGEKLHEQHVQRAIAESCRALHLQPTFALMFPVTAAPPYYRLVVEGQEKLQRDRLGRELAARVEAVLCHNPQYRAAVEFGQLLPVEVVVLPLPPGTAWRVYERRCRQRGQKPGDIKPLALDRWPGWSTEFASAAASPG